MNNSKQPIPKTRNLGSIHARFRNRSPSPECKRSKTNIKKSNLLRPKANNIKPRVAQDRIDMMLSICKGSSTRSDGPNRFVPNALKAKPKQKRLCSNVRKPTRLKSKTKRMKSKQVKP